jgi:hypothetical protein
MVVFWVVALCSLVEVYRRFRGACCLNLQGSPETSANFYQTTWRNNPEDIYLYNRHRENLESHEKKKIKRINRVGLQKKA